MNSLYQVRANGVDNSTPPVPFPALSIGPTSIIRPLSIAAAKALCHLLHHRLQAIALSICIRGRRSSGPSSSKVASNHKKNLGLISLPPTRQSSATHPSPDSGLATSEGAPGDPSPPLLPPSPPPFSEGLTQVAFLSLPIPQLQVPSFPSDRSQPGLRTSG